MTTKKAINTETKISCKPLLGIRKIDIPCPWGLKLVKTNEKLIENKDLVKSLYSSSSNLSS